jgi:hypothetical protein
MSFAIEQERSALKAAFEIQRRAELVEIRVTHCNAKGFEGEPSFQGPLKLGLASQSKVHLVSPGKLRIEVCLEFKAKDSAGEHAKTVFTLDLGFMLAYDLEDDYLPPEEQVSAFKDGNAIFNCWPFARELAQNLTMRMGITVPPIPLFRVVPKTRPEELESKKPSKNIASIKRRSPQLSTKS